MVTLITLVEIAQQQSVRLKRDKCHEEVVHGKLGLLYDHVASRFGMVFEASAKSRRFGNTLRFRKRRAFAAVSVYIRKATLKRSCSLTPAMQNRRG